MRTRDRRIELIRQLPPFAAASTQELRDLAAAADLIAVPAGEVLCHEGRPALETYVVVDGFVDVVLGSSHLARLGRGEVVGELGVLDSQPRSADVVAATDVQLLVFPARTMRALVETSHAMRRAVLRQLADRLRKGDEDLSASTG